MTHLIDKDTVIAEIERKYNEWKLGNSAEAKYRCEAYKELIELIKPMQEEPVSKVLDTESMIESHKQKLISQVNGMKNSPFVNMCLDSYKQGINEILDTLNLSSAQTIDATIGYWNHSGLSIDVKLPKDLKEGSKCKLIIIKDEQL